MFSLSFSSLKLRNEACYACKTDSLAKLKVSQTHTSRYNTIIIYMEQLYLIMINLPYSLLNTGEGSAVLVFTPLYVEGQPFR